MGEKVDFEQETRDRLTRIETMLQMVSGNCPSCQARITALEIGHAEQAASAKSAHLRLDNIKTDVGLVVTIIGAVFTALNFILHK